jgi:hypothetical protein
VTAPRTFPAGPGPRTVPLEGPWLRSVSLLRVDGTHEARTPPGEETLAVLLAGTLDLFAGGSSWLQRGLRPDAFSGRPCGLYLPPAIGVRFVGRGEILLASGKRPDEPPAAAAAKPDRASLPLLPLAGSGKAYDARTGTWELLERFPSSPEAVLPRGIETALVDGVAVQRVFSYAFKALALCLDECVLAPGQSLVPPRPQTPPGVTHGEELAFFVRTEGEARVHGTEVYRVTGDAVVPVGAPAAVRCEAVRGRTYLATIWGGPKAS